ncbi:hypothetical protein AB833_05890 [Chromatiales bacterium (ex Bugula neritina AB1)]|nr:hypothetical protein AB833_05890 [Chromatiales bacterium (ex Bugula neritina AB1)]
MRKLLPVAAAVGLIFGNHAHAIGLDLSFSDETANLELMSPISSLIENGGQASLGVFFNDVDDIVIHGKLIAVGNQTNSRLPYKLSFGAKLYGGEVDVEDGDDVDVGALAIGGAFDINLTEGFNPIDLALEGYFTPGITTFGDTESILEIGARLSIEVVPQAKAFLGYRLLEVEDDRNITFELDDNVHFGIRLEF